MARRPKDFSDLLDMPYRNRMLGPKLSAEARRDTAIVSCAKQGEPKHPSKKVTNAFRRRGSPVWATQGIGLHWQHDAPARPGWNAADALPFYNQVEDE